LTIPAGVLRPNKGALRPPENFDSVEVEYREALEDRIFENDVVVDDADRLRRVEVEVGVAEPADVEAREGRPKRAFDVEARNPSGKARISAPPVLIAANCCRSSMRPRREVLDVLRTALARDDDVATRPAVAGGGLPWLGGAASIWAAAAWRMRVASASAEIDDESSACCPRIVVGATRHAPSYRLYRRLFSRSAQKATLKIHSGELVRRPDQAVEDSRLVEQVPPVRDDVELDLRPCLLEPPARDRRGAGVVAALDDHAGNSAQLRLARPSSWPSSIQPVIRHVVILDPRDRDRDFGAGEMLDRLGARRRVTMSPSHLLHALAAASCAVRISLVSRLR
jgi:hypothetical protein